MASRSEAHDFYRGYSKHTDPGEYADLFEGLPESLRDLCAWVKRVLIHSAEVARYTDLLPEGRTREDSDFYSVHDMLRELVNRNPRGLTMTRKPAEKLVLSCRFHAMLLASAMKSRGIPARVRVGFAGYLVPEGGKHFDLYACLNNELIYCEGPELFHKDAGRLSTEERAFVNQLARLLKHPEENLETLMKLQVESPRLQNIRGTAPAL